MITLTALPDDILHHLLRFGGPKLRVNRALRDGFEDVLSDDHRQILELMRMHFRYVRAATPRPSYGDLFNAWWVAEEFMKVRVGFCDLWFAECHRPPRVRVYTQDDPRRVQDPRSHLVRLAQRIAKCAAAHDAADAVEYLRRSTHVCPRMWAVCEEAQSE